jgi:ABC-type glycerol-3-phosphate transport system permease component
MKSKYIKELITKIIIYIILIIGGVIFAFPYVWMFSTALKEPGTEFLSIFPRNPSFKHFIDAWTILPFTRWGINSIYVTVFATIGQIISASLVAFGFARTNFRGRDALFVLCLSSLMIPFQVIMVPHFILFKSIGWLDTFWPLIVPFFFGGNAFFIFLLRQYFLTIPLEMDDAAKIDGCSTFSVYLRIILPLSKPILGMVAIFSFMWRWNDFLGPLVFISSTEKYTLSLGLRFFQGQYYINWSYLMAVSLISVIPCLILFFVAQRYYVQGIVVTGIK